MKLIFLDVETTGDNFSKCAITQIAGIIRINGRIVKRFDIKMKPHPGALVNFNLKSSKRHSKDYETGFIEFRHVLEKYVNPYDPKDKFFMVAYNSNFDESFIRSWFLRNDCKFFGSYFWNPSIDVMQMAQYYLMAKKERHELKNMKLCTVAEYFGVTVQERRLHEATYDALILKDTYNVLNRKLKGRI